MMKNSEFRIAVAIIALITVFGLLWGGFTLYKKLRVEEPLTKGLREIKAVSSVSVTKDKVYVIEVKLDKVEDIQSVYQSLIKAIEGTLKENEYELVILDNENKVLKDLYKELQPVIYEGLANNGFVWLDETLAKTVKGDVIIYDLFVDEENLYIQLFNGDYYMYKILPRPSAITANL
ncbi:MAG: hypothetical protein GX790_07965 [Syntrophomonadaceae bacterium]|nr:hypothetical protein [Syntrophomonadaceae bacterium]